MAESVVARYHFLPYPYGEPLVSDTPFAPSPRRRFLAALAGGTAAVAATGLGAGALLAQGGGLPAYPPPQGGWDVAWADRIQKAKHKVVFDCAQVANGLALTNAAVYMAGWKDVYNTMDADLGVVVVIRHEAIQMVLDDSIWNRWKVGEQLNVQDAGQPAMRNTFAGRPSAEGRAGDGMIGLIERGAVVLCCNLALMRSAGQFARAMSVPVDEARKHFIDSLVPGVVRQTNGIFAVTRAQEAGAVQVKST